MVTRHPTVLLIVIILVGTLLLAILVTPWRKHLDEATLQAMVENAKLRSEITTLEAANGAYKDYYDCTEIKRQLGIGG